MSIKGRFIKWLNKTNPCPECGGFDFRENNVIYPPSHESTVGIYIGDYEVECGDCGYIETHERNIPPR